MLARPRFLKQINDLYPTLQFDGSKYFPVTYWRRVCLASGASDGCVIAARVTKPATETDTTSMPPVRAKTKPNCYNLQFIQGVAE